MTESPEEPDPPVDKVTTDGVNATPGPAGETVPVKFTAPAKPLRPVRVTAEVPVEPTGMVREEVPKEMLKSDTLTVTVAE